MELLSNEKDDFTEAMIDNAQDKFDEFCAQYKVTIGRHPQEYLGLFNRLHRLKVVRQQRAVSYN